MKNPIICRYCGGKITLADPREIFGDSVERLGLDGEYIYLCRTCNARVGCHKGTTRPLGNVANEVLRLKRRETHQIFDTFWSEAGMTRTRAYQWLGQQMGMSARKAHIGSFEMDQCQQVIDLCQLGADRKAA
ncbi:zinc-finger-containing protein [Bengtsoniella intestinalis]|uniref:zinc-finger-containing protein n=1 Tax=Bengtsoniella intestinalis TaxID=3073143 RepID=UPI00391EE5A0